MSCTALSHLITSSSNTFITNAFTTTKLTAFDHKKSHMSSIVFPSRRDSSKRPAVRPQRAVEHASHTHNSVAHMRTICIYMHLCKVYCLQTSRTHKCTCKCVSVCACVSGNEAYSVFPSFLKTMLNISGSLDKFCRTIYECYWCIPEPCNVISRHTNMSTCAKYMIDNGTHCNHAALQTSLTACVFSVLMQFYWSLCRLCLRIILLIIIYMSEK